MRPKGPIQIAIIFLYSKICDAASQASVHNLCDFPVYLKSFQLEPSQLYRLGPGEWYNETYCPDAIWNPASQTHVSTGVSIKITKNKELEVSNFDSDQLFHQSPVTQFEYTFVPGAAPGPDLFYDLSDIDDISPRQFCAFGMKLASTSGTCEEVVCPPDCAGNCSQVYNFPKDDYATKGCRSDEELILSLCSFR